MWRGSSTRSPKAHITRRLAFAQEHQDWTDEQWAHILFADETYICLGAQGRVWVQRPEDAAFLSEYMVQGQTNFAPKIGIWACFSSKGVGALRIFDDTMDTRLYTDTMQRFMKPSALRFWPAARGSTFRTTLPITSLAALRPGSTTTEWIWWRSRPTRLT